jgi:hypothetical protein
MEGSEDFPVGLVARVMIAVSLLVVIAGIIWLRSSKCNPK